MRQRRAEAVTLSATAELKLCALQREDKDDVLALFDDELLRREHFNPGFREQLRESFDSDVTERYRGVPVYLGVRSLQDGSLLAWLQIEGLESTKALGPTVALGCALIPTAATGPMAFKILRLALGWLHDVAKFDAVSLAISADDEDSIVTAVGARFACEEPLTFGDGSTHVCKHYFSLSPAAVKRVQAKLRPRRRI